MFSNTASLRRAYAALAITLFGFAVVTSKASASPLLLAGDQDTSTAGHRIMAFSPANGSTVNLSFVPSDSTRFTTPKGICDSGRGFFVSDQIKNAIYEYGYDGVYIRTVVDSTQISNPRGVAVFNDHLYVADSNSIQQFNMDGTGKTPFVTGLTSPREILVRANDLLVTQFATSVSSSAANADIVKVPLTGGTFSNFYLGASTTTDLTGAEQIVKMPDNDPRGAYAVAGFSGTSPNNNFGIYTFDANGAKQNFYFLGTGPKSVNVLDNGNFIYADGTGVRTFNTLTSAVTTIASGPNGNFFKMINTPEPASISLFAGGALIGLSRRRRQW